MTVSSRSYCYFKVISLALSLSPSLFFACTDPTEKEEKMKESLERAKEAVALDIKDGMSWSKKRSFHVFEF